MKIFGERLKQLRVNRNLTQDEFGSLFRLAPSTIGTYERGLREPTYETLVKMSDYFNVSTDYLLGKNEDPFTLDEYKKVNATEISDFLKQQEILFNGKTLTKEEKQRILDILTAIFWDTFAKL